MIPKRHSAWTTRFAIRTYLAGVAWTLGSGLAWLTSAPDPGGWLQPRVDTVGLLYLAAAVAGGSNFFGAGVRAALRARLDMYFLMSLALVAAFLIGEPFEGATLAFLFSAAELLEQYAVSRGRRAIAALVAMAPEQASLVNADGTTRTVPVAELSVGDRVRIRPGDKVPADGIVRSGASHVNEASITGESLPRGKGVGDSVFAGTSNADGALDIEVTADAKHSAFARIIELVRAAEQRRAPTEQLVRRFARIYTPIVVLAAILTALVPSLIAGAPSIEWITRAITLLVIACPCALVIATPVSMVSGLTSAARHGVLIKGGDHLEALAGIKALAVDKTGTITTGQLEVEGFHVSEGSRPDRVLSLVASAEAHSEHPMAKALVRHARARGVSTNLTVREFAAARGKGITAQVDGLGLRVGTREFVQSAGAPSPSRTSGATEVVAVISTGEQATIFLRDKIRPDAGPALAELHALGVAPVIMLTGDAEPVAMEVARQVGIGEVLARLLPEDKVNAVTRMRELHGSIAMIGDGVNDAPAIASATVGIVMGAAGAPATIEVADVALLADDFTRLPYAIRLARRTRTAIRVNIAVALVLKLILGVGAAAGIVNLAVAVLVGDMGGSLLVTLNALRISRVPAPRPVGSSASRKRGNRP